MEVTLRQGRVFRLLEDFRGIEPLKRLFWSELNYDRESSPVSRRGWPETVSGVLAEDPAIFASSGADNGFEVIQCRLDSERRSSLEKCLDAKGVGCEEWEAEIDGWQRCTGCRIRVAVSPADRGGEGAAMTERTEMRIDRALLEDVRLRAAEEGRGEEELIEEAVGRYLREGGEGESAERPWPRYPLLDSGDPTFAEWVEDELAGFGER